MANAVSYELLQSKLGAANGIATLDSSGYIPESQLPPGAIETYKGQYATSAALILAYPSATLADYAYVTETTSFWYWNSELATWVNQEIEEDAYNALTAAAKAVVPYLVVPNV